MASLAEKLSEKSGSDPPIAKRCQERVVEARITATGSSFMHGANQPLFVGEGRAGTGGTRVASMALHPAGLAVVHAAGKAKGWRMIIPLVHVEYFLLAEGEE